MSAKNGKASSPERTVRIRVPKHLTGIHAQRAWVKQALAHLTQLDQELTAGIASEDKSRAFAGMFQEQPSRPHK